MRRRRYFYGDTAAMTPLWRRAQVLGAIEEAAGLALSPSDPLPDTLIATAQALGLSPADLQIWIYDEPRRQCWTIDALTRWAREYRHPAE